MGILKTQPNKWFSMKELKEELKLGKTTVFDNIRRLINNDEVDVKEDGLRRFVKSKDG